LRVGGRMAFWEVLERVWKKEIIVSDLASFSPHNPPLTSLDDEEEDGVDLEE